MSSTDALQSGFYGVSYMSHLDHSHLFLALLHLLRPLSRLLLKRGVSYGVFAEAAKLAFVEAAQHDLALPGRKQTTSRISTMTGLSRKEVLHLLTKERTGIIEAQHKLSRTARVIGGWIADSRFTNKKHQPLLLPFEGAQPNFSELVRDYSGDIPPRTIADELSRLGAVTVTEKGELQLLQKAYIPQTGSDEQFEILAEDVSDLVNTIAHNLEQADPAQRRFQRKVFYNNVPIEYVDELRLFIATNGQQCLETINRKLAKYDRDNNAKLRGTQRMKIGLEMHAIEEKLS
jgi:hypothetical protein